jgi:predicted PurR-regulated permease PerM
MKNLIYFLPAAAVAAGVILFRDRLTHIVVPFALAAVLTMILSPPTVYLSRKTKLNKSGSAALSMIAFVLIIILLIAGIMPVFLDSLREVVNNSGEIASEVESTVGKLNLSLQRILGVDSDSDASVWMNQTARSLCDRLFHSLENWASGILDRIAESYGEIFAAVFDGITALVITFYLLRDGRQLRIWALDAFPFRWREPVACIFSDLGKIFSDFLKGQLLVSLILGITQTCGLLMLGIPYAPILGFFGGVLNIIPYFGPFIGAVPAVLAAFFVSPLKALWTALLFIVLQQIDNNLLTPKIVEGKLGVHPVTTIITVFLGGEFFGLWGVLLAVPVYAALRSILRRVLPAVRLPA